MSQGVPIWFSEDLLKNRVVLGKDAFKDWVYQNHADKNKKDVPKIEKTPKPKISIKEIIDQVSFAYNVPTSSIRNQKAKKFNEPRSMAIYLARKLTGLKQKDLTKWFKVSNAFAIAKQIQRFKVKLKTQKKLQRIVNLVERSLLS